MGPDVPAGLVDQGGNSGFSTTFCGSWPTPVYGGDNGGGPTDPPTGNLAQGKQITASGSVGGFPPANAVDGNANSYWESRNNAFPQWLQVDLGAAVSVNQTVLKLPPAAAWQTRTQTLTVQGSTTGTSFADLKAKR